MHVSLYRAQLYIFKIEDTFVGVFQPGEIINFIPSSEALTITLRIRVSWSKALEVDARGCNLSRIRNNMKPKANIFFHT